MIDIKVGDKVRRIEGEYNDMHVGDEAVVTGVSKFGISLEGHIGEHSPTKFELVKTEPTVSIEPKETKWTHTFEGRRCWIGNYIEDEDGYVPVMINEYGWDCVRLSLLTPVVGDLTKAEAWDMCQEYDGDLDIETYMYELSEKYNII